jgi:hypothetical protein
MLRKKFLFLFIPFLCLISSQFAFAQDLNSILSRLIYQPNEPYESGRSVILSIEDGEIYTSTKFVPAASDGSNAPKTANAIANEYWGDQTVTTLAFAQSNPNFESSVPDMNTTELSLQVAGMLNPALTITPSGLTSSTNESFVAQQYLDFLGRDGDDEGIAYWANLIANGTIYRADVIDFFVSSAEFQSVIAPVSRLYLAYFKRLPDTDGLKHWIELKLNGMALNDISQHFSDSTEFQSTYGNLSNEDFVKLVYQNVLGRESDVDGLIYWAGLLNGGTLNFGTVMTQFSESAENISLTNNNIRVISFYYGMLGRAPDLDGYNYWVQQFENGAAANALLNAFYLGAEYQDRANISADLGGFGK